MEQERTQPASSLPSPQSSSGRVGTESLIQEQRNVLLSWVLLVLAAELTCVAPPLNVDASAIGAAKLRERFTGGEGWKSSLTVVG